jgi:hypothetical protein
MGAIAIAGLLAGCGASTTSNASNSSTSSTPTPTTEAKPVALHLNQGSYSVSSPGTTITGTASDGASVTVNGQAATVHGGRWRDRLHLELGSNAVEVGAQMGGRATARAVIQITRHHSAAELEAEARARAQRAEEDKRHEVEQREHKERERREEHEKESSPPPGQCPNGTYENSKGNIVCKPYAPSNGEQPAGASAECEDRTYSFSESRSGTCSHHGGVKRWLNE